MKNRIDKLEDKYDALSEDITLLKVEISSTTEITKSAHKRLDGIDGEIELDRKVKHQHATEITRHDGILTSHEGLFMSIKDGLREGFSELASAMKDNVKESLRQDRRIFRIELMVGAIITLGTVVAGAASWVIAHVGTLVGWW